MCLERSSTRKEEHILHLENRKTVLEKTEVSTDNPRAQFYASVCNLVTQGLFVGKRCFSANLYVRL